ncbi:MAG: winged helix-turn-helix domain-containing protein [Gammaproteobacteria bacterium]
MSENSLKIVSFDGFTLDLETGELTHNGKPIALRPKARTLLVSLVSAHGKTVSHEKLYQQIWGNGVVQQQDGIHRLIRDIRTALGDGQQSRHYLENIPRVGYRFTAQLLPPAVVQSATRPRPQRAFLAGFLAFPAAFLVFCLIAAQTA